MRFTDIVIEDEQEKIWMLCCWSRVSLDDVTHHHPAGVVKQTYTSHNTSSTANTYAQCVVTLGFVDEPRGGAELLAQWSDRMTAEHTEQSDSLHSTGSAWWLGKNNIVIRQQNNCNSTRISNIKIVNSTN